MAYRPYGLNVLITGASSGIGLACLRLFSSKGYHVWAVSRSGTMEQPISSHVHPYSMDVTKDESVTQGISHIWKEAIKLTNEGIGIVIHCAGYGIGGAAEDTPLEAVRAQFETNYFGVLRVNGELLPLMRSRSRSLVVLLGSIAGRISIPYQSHYSASKFALEAYTEALRMEGSLFGIRATIVEAGDTHTAFTKKRILAMPSDSPYLIEAQRAIEKMEHDEQSGYEPSTVASVVYKVANRRNPPVRIAVGLSYKMLMLLKRLLPDSLAQWVVSHMYLGR